MIGPIEQQVVELVCSECDALKTVGGALYCNHRDAHKYHRIAHTSQGPLAYICKDSPVLTPPWCPALQQDRVWDIVQEENNG